MPEKAKRPGIVGAHFSTNIILPHFIFLSRGIFNFFCFFLTPFVFKSIVSGFPREVSP